MKKLVNSCSALALLASFSPIFAGGIEPLPVDYFSGITIGLVGSFWHNSWNVDGAGIIDCESTNGQNAIILAPEFTIDHLGNCAIPIIKTASSGEATITFGPPIESPSIGTFANNGDAIDKTGAIGGQLTIGKVLSAHTMNYYLGIYGGGQWGDSNESISYTEDTKNLQALFDLAGRQGSGELFINSFKQSVHAELNTQVKMENVYNVGAQLGLLLAPSTMAYTKFGAAWSKISAQTSFNIDFPELPIGFKSGSFTDEQSSRGDFLSLVNLSGLATTSIEETEIGYEIGAGVSQALTENLILSLEYVFRDFGQVHANKGDIFIPADLFTSNTTVTLDSDFDKPLIINFGEVANPLFYQATQASAKLHQSAFNAVLAYRFNWLH